MKNPHKQPVRTTSRRANKLLTRKEYAVHRGVTRQRVDRLIAQGRIPLNEDGRIDPLIADALLESTMPEAAKAGNGKASPGLERLRLAQAQRAEVAKQLLELELRRRQGAIEEEVTRHVVAVLGIVKSRLRSLPRRLAPQVAGVNPWAAEELLKREHNEALADAAGFLREPQGEIVQRMLAEDSGLEGHLREQGYEDWVSGENHKQEHEKEQGKEP